MRIILMLNIIIKINESLVLVINLNSVLTKLSGFKYQQQTSIFHK